MTKFTTFSTLTALLLATTAQVDPIPLTPDALILIGGAAIEQHGAPFGFGAAVLKDQYLQNDTIEYAVLFDETATFGGIIFRAQGPDDAEEFYMCANQYMPRYNGVPGWQLYYSPQYATPIDYNFDGWNQVKLEISDARADIFINDMTKPALAADLLRDPATGGITLWGLNIGGEVWFSNINVTPTDKIALKGTPVPPTAAALATVQS